MIAKMTSNEDFEDEIDRQDNEEVHPPSIVVLSVNMIERGCEAIDEIKYLVTEFGQRHKNKETLMNNYLELIAVLAYDELSTTQDRGREVTTYSLMANNIDGIMNNYKLKSFAQDKVLLY